MDSPGASSKNSDAPGRVGETMSTTLSEPKYVGHVSDGWFLDSQGRLHYRAPDVDVTRGRLHALLGDLPDDGPAGPLIRLVAIDGVAPSLMRAAAIERELSKAPPRVLAVFRSRGGTIDIVPGEDASRHPQCGQRPPPGKIVRGWCSRGEAQPLIVVAVAGDPRAVLHELGHWHDRSDRFSGLSEWQRIVAADRMRGTRLEFHGGYEFLFDDGHNGKRSPREAYAEAFAMFFSGPETRRRLTRAMREFIAKTADRL